MTAIWQGQDCLSTHGAAGYAPGTAWNGEALICGLCKARIENPPPTRWRIVPYTLGDVWRNWRLFGAWWRDEPKARIPCWPDWLGGRRAR